MERRAIAIQGTVQGVGFRPHVYRLAVEHALGGCVRNNSGGVQIEVEGEERSLDQFLAQLIHAPPPLARIDAWSCEVRLARGEREFHIDPSDNISPGHVVITPDAGTCDACLAEIIDPRERRYRYPFTNCTHCGPRMTIVTGAPYDRQHTTLSRFSMCADCSREYQDPADRRFHAQPIACPACGPKLSLHDSGGGKLDCIDPLQQFEEAVRAGKIGAMKGLGGYHLVCDATNAKAVAELRQRKHRDEKPFAVMVRDIASAAFFGELNPLSRELLISQSRPIVLLRNRRLDQSASGKRASLQAALLAEEVAPGNPFVGIMLPYTPLHYLLLDDLGGLPLIMTSGNRSDDPIAHTEPEVFHRLSGIADIFLTNDRLIHVRCDDSVTRAVDGQESPIRRSRGYAPGPVFLPMQCSAPILAVGGQMKATFALATDRTAVLSHHLGDLDHFEAFTAFEKDVALYEQLYSLHPLIVAHDLHPDYASTRYAQARAASNPAVQPIPVQHHHAHMASCMVEHRLTEPVIGVTFDGTGFGTDGAIWGGEFLVGDYRSFYRAAHLRYVGLPGGEQAVRDPWRMAVAHLLDASACCHALEKRCSPKSLRIVRTMLARKFNSPMTSSAGRLFDAVAAIIGLRDRVSYEGQAAIELEWLATGAVDSAAYSFAIESARNSAPQLGGTDYEAEKSANALRGPSSPMSAAPAGAASDQICPMQIDTRPMIREIVRDVEAGARPDTIARRFHATIVEIIFAACTAIASRTGVGDVVLSGGVFMNALLSNETTRRLKKHGFNVYRHRLVPPNDGGLSLGQAAIAASLLNDRI